MKVFCISSILVLLLMNVPVFGYYFFEPALLIVSFDAFRHDFFFRNQTPYLNFLRSIGITVPYVKNVFPTVTHANHQSTATGYPAEVHGIFGPSCYDSKERREVKGEEMYSYNPKIIPIWAWNEKMGFISGCHGWPGSQFAYAGIFCTYRQREIKSEPWKERVNTVVSWFSNPRRPANFAVLYFDQPDTIMHAFGPDSNEANHYINAVDQIAEYITWKLRKAGQSRVNVIFLSDHGMDWTWQPNFINLNKIIPKESYKYYGHSPILQIVPTDEKKSSKKQIYDKLKQASKTLPFSVYYGNNLPAKWKANNAQRFGPIVVVADPKYAFQDKYASQKRYEKVFGIKVSNRSKYGMHGYDNDHRPMNSMFVAVGKNFRKRINLKPFHSTSLISLFCKVLKIKCPKTGGPNNDHVWDRIVVH